MKASAAKPRRSIASLVALAFGGAIAAVIGAAVGSLVMLLALSALVWTCLALLFTSGEWWPVTICSFFLLLFAAPIAAVLFSILVHDRVTRRFRQPGHCPQCGYDRRGNPDAKACPECGAGARA